MRWREQLYAEGDADGRNEAMAALTNYRRENEPLGRFDAYIGIEKLRASCARIAMGATNRFAATRALAYANLCEQSGSIGCDIVSINDAYHRHVWNGCDRALSNAVSALAQLRTIEEWRAFKTSRRDI